MPASNRIKSLDRYKVAVPEGKSGDWEVSRFSVGAFEDEPERQFQAMLGRDIPEGKYTRIAHNHRTIMSDTPAEISDHLLAIRYIELIGGYVLVNGLGLGLVVKAALACSGVERVDVVEISQDVISLVAPTYQDDPRLHIHHDNAFTFKPPKGLSWSVIWHDIWSNIDSNNLPEMTKLHRKYASKCVGWQGSWCKELCRLYRQEGF